MDANASNIHHIFVVPVLLFTLMFGPSGYVLYTFLKFFNRVLFNGRSNREPLKIE